MPQVDAIQVVIQKIYCAQRKNYDSKKQKKDIRQRKRTNLNNLPHLIIDFCF
jgi:hypothetical protein